MNTPNSFMYSPISPGRMAMPMSLMEAHQTHHHHTQNNSPFMAHSSPLPPLSAGPKAVVGYNYSPEASSVESPVVLTPGSFQSYQQSQPKSTVFSTDGSVHNLPASMVKDQFGIAGLMIAYKMAAQGLSPYGFGEDYMAKMNMFQRYEPAEQQMHESFAGPFREETNLAVHSQEVNFFPEYHVTSRMISENRVPNVENLRKNWALRVEKFNEDLLFYLFYTFHCDMLQIVAATHLYAKGWRYHMEMKVWLQRLNDAYVTNKDGTCEKGIYKYFDSVNWKINQTELIVELSKLERQPTVPYEYLQYQFLNREAA